MADTEYDVIVLGAGPAGENVAARAMKGGLTAAIVEVELVGGECSYWACMPSKALLRRSQAVAAAHAVDGARQAVRGDVDAAAVLARRDRFAHHWKDDGQVRWLDGAHIALVRGWGRLAGERRVAVQGPDGRTTTLTARQAVVVATGSGAAIPPVPGLAEARPWTSREATSAQRAPGRLAVIGGGVVACEMATAWRALGAREVTLLVRSRARRARRRRAAGREPESLLGDYEPFVGELLAAARAGARARRGR